MSPENLEERREAILGQMKKIRLMRRGAINEQYLKVPQQGGEPLLRGPYYVLSWNEDGKTRSVRIKPEEIDRTRQDTKAYKEFQALAKEFVEVTEAMTKKFRSEAADLKKTPSQ